MGYTTDFDGAFFVTPTLTPEHRAYLAAFASTRRMKRNPELTAKRPDPIREAVGLPVGPDGAYFVGATDDFRGQEHTDDIVDYNTPPGTPDMHSMVSYKSFATDYPKYVEAKEMAVAEGAQPGLWCQWVPTDDGTMIVWDEGEKFYDYVEWLRYLIEHFLRPWGYTLNGAVIWQGEESDDRGRIHVNNNAIETFVAKTTFVRS
jgi:hypothetical protein